MKHLIIVIVLISVFTSCNKKTEHTSLLGSWTCEELPELTTPSTYQVSISRDYTSKDTNQYVISNFYKLGIDQQFEVHFYESKTGELIINQQTVGNIAVYGTGTYSADYSKIEWEYYVNSGDVNQKVKATYY